MTTPVKNLVITGSPGVGKTTLLKECSLAFREQVGGFFTEEVREGAERRGFVLRTLDGKTGVFAQKGMKSAHRVNKYGIDLRVLEELGVASIRSALDEKKVVIVDEIGTMEMMSPAFREAVTTALASPTYFLATIRLKAEPFTSQIRKMSNTLLIKLERRAYLETKARVREWLEAVCR